VQPLIGWLKPDKVALQMKFVPISQKLCPHYYDICDVMDERHSTKPLFATGTTMNFKGHADDRNDDSDADVLDGDVGSNALKPAKKRVVPLVAREKPEKWQKTVEEREAQLLSFKQREFESNNSFRQAQLDMQRAESLANISLANANATLSEHKRASEIH
jgi:hypothetical protein